MQSNNFLKEEIGNITSIIYFVAWNEMASLVKGSTTTKIESIPLDFLGCPRMKSIEMSTKGMLGMGRGVYKPWG